jgi:hypothetical protein
MPEDEAKLRIMEWCVAGIAVDNDASGRDVHMAVEPIAIPLPLRSLAELTRLADAV